MTDQPGRYAVGTEFVMDAPSRDDAEAVARVAMQKRRIPAAWDIHISYAEPYNEDDE